MRIGEFSSPVFAEWVGLAIKTRLNFWNRPVSRRPAFHVGQGVIHDIQQIRVGQVCLGGEARLTATLQQN
jgi:hypothetical protein